jgi:hypothetical protein
MNSKTNQGLLIMATALFVVGGLVVIPALDLHDAYASTTEQTLQKAQEKRENAAEKLAEKRENSTGINLFKFE